jgi:hypothetical protein
LVVREGVATRLEYLDGTGFESHLGHGIFLFSKSPDWFWGLPNLLFNGYRDSFSEAKRPVRGVNYSPPFSAEVTNEWNYTSILLYAFMTGKSVDNNLQMPDHIPQQKTLALGEK